MAMETLDQKLWALILGGFCAVLATIISVIEMVNHCKHNHDPVLRIHLLRILFMIPMYSFNAWVGLMMKEHTEYWDLARESYEAVVIYSFYEFLVAYIGGAQRLVFLATVPEDQIDKTGTQEQMEQMAREGLLGTEYIPPHITSADGSGDSPAFRPLTGPGSIYATANANANANGNGNGNGSAGVSVFSSSELLDRDDLTSIDGPLLSTTMQPSSSSSSLSSAATAVAPASRPKKKDIYGRLDSDVFFDPELVDEASLTVEETDEKRKKLEAERAAEEERKRLEREALEAERIDPSQKAAISVGETLPPELAIRPVFQYESVADDPYITQAEMKYHPREHRHMIPCRWCCRGKITPGDFVQKTKYGALQYVPIQLFTGSMTFILSAIGAGYTYGAFNAQNAYPYLAFLTNCSQIWAMYCLFWFYDAYKEQLAPCKPLWKAACIKGIVFFTFWQSVLINLWSYYYPVDCDEHFNPMSPRRVCTADDYNNEQRGRAIQDFMICVEMLLFAIWHMKVFSYKEFMHRPGSDDRPLFRRVVTFFNPSDMLRDMKGMVSRRRNKPGIPVAQRVGAGSEAPLDANGTRIPASVRFANGNTSSSSSSSSRNSINIGNVSSSLSLGRERESVGADDISNRGGARGKDRRGLPTATTSV